MTTLRAAELFTTAGDRRTVDQLLQRFGAEVTYRHLLERWLRLLAASGVLRRDGDDYVADRPLADPNLQTYLAEARSRLADNPALIAYIEHCGGMLRAVLTGREGPLETLFPNGSFEMAESLYERSAPMRYCNALAASALEALIAARLPGAPLRVLEIGAGTGGTASSLIPLCPAASTTYWFTDVTPVFFERAREKYAAWPFLRFGTFDLERDPQAQGFPLGSFDLIIAANAVHATRDLPASLRTIRSLLAPGGVLLLVEFDRASRLVRHYDRLDRGLAALRRRSARRQSAGTGCDLDRGVACCWFRSGRPLAVGAIRFS